MFFNIDDFGKNKGHFPLFINYFIFFPFFTNYLYFFFILSSFSFIFQPMFLLYIFLQL